MLDLVAGVNFVFALLCFHNNNNNNHKKVLCVAYVKALRQLEDAKFSLCVVFISSQTKINKKIEKKLIQNQNTEMLESWGFSLLLMLDINLVSC